MGEPLAFILSGLLIAVWTVLGRCFYCSDTWQLIVNGSTTVLTLLTAFLVQKSQNRDGAEIQARLEEILRSLDAPRNQFVGIKNLTDAQICQFRNARERA